MDRKIIRLVIAIIWIIAGIALLFNNNIPYAIFSFILGLAFIYFAFASKNTK